MVTTKNEARMKLDPQYANGCRNGYDMCKKMLASFPIRVLNLKETLRFA